MIRLSGSHQSLRTSVCTVHRGAVSQQRRPKTSPGTRLAGARGGEAVRHNAQSSQRHTIGDAQRSHYSVLTARSQTGTGDTMSDTQSQTGTTRCAMAQGHNTTLSVSLMGARGGLPFCIHSIGVPLRG
eukprot:3265875-Prymnesium_polylepis.2